MISVLALIMMTTPETLVGELQTVGSALNHATVLHVGQQDVPLVGEWLPELTLLGGVRIEVVGERGLDKRFKVLRYSILQTGDDGTKPVVGQLVALGGESFAVQDGVGAPISLNLSPGGKRQLRAYLGAKIWVYGRKLLSGELQMQGFGVLRAAPAAKVADPNLTKGG